VSQRGAQPHGEQEDDAQEADVQGGVHAIETPVRAPTDTVATERDLA
jgi:hypothetical protein